MKSNNKMKRLLNALRKNKRKTEGASSQKKLPLCETCASQYNVNSYSLVEALRLDPATVAAGGT